MTATYDSIATTTLSSAALTITFSSIPNTYTDLKLTLVGHGSSLSTVKMRFNNDSNTNYSRTGIQAYGSGNIFSGRITSSDSINSNYEFSDSSSAPSFFNADIFSYLGSTNKTSLMSIFTDRNTTDGGLAIAVGLWRSTAAITSITLGLNFSNWPFQSGTTATLYGIKAE